MLFSARNLVLGLWLAHVSSCAYNATVCGSAPYTSPNGDLNFNANAWNADSQGFSCLSVQTSPPAFDSTWAWSSNPNQVHSYPHVKFKLPDLPVLLSNISALSLSAQWSMGPGSTPLPALSVDISGLADADTTANVAFDMFADPNPANAQNETLAATEIMIWLGYVGTPVPLGFSSKRTCFNQMLGTLEFILYQGKNSRGTDVFTWMATTNETSFSAEISPLLQYLWRNGLVPSNSSLGLVEFGSEAYHSESNVTFSATSFDAELVTGAAPNLTIASLPTACSDAGSARRQGSWLLSRVSILGILGYVLYLI
ncbi:concanavalin A-like lectin/glucanase domain-containing protein [Diplogelasinospora grovesii]|uniref:Concanavalin A-like lectin/glucanase domain-containing protein n=1 Tax=Diplogelasinospora grovesii TaxID=303347 RepID=A0AAN6S459_9PEZI|nr:concanavalin A-like lectin/glucanase domain-containing protein [Diplogelasinospora grovesii]